MRAKLQRVMCHDEGHEETVTDVITLNQKHRNTSKVTLSGQLVGIQQVGDLLPRQLDQGSSIPCIIGPQLFRERYLSQGEDTPMAWRMTGQLHELCSCKMWCPCWLGPEVTPDEGWCGGAILLDIEDGEAEGVPLSGCKAVWVADWPASFWAGNGTGRVYIDERATPDQRRALEAILMGQQGGPWAVVASAVITTWLPTCYTPIAIHWGEDTTATIGTVGQITSHRLRNEAGQPTTVQGAAAMGAFQLARADIAYTAGSRWSDPDLHHWEGSSGTRSTFQWTA